MERTWKEVGELFRHRRNSLGLSQDEVVAVANERAGKQVASTANLRIFEKGGRGRYRPSTLIGIARGVRWPDDAARRLRNGADPADLDNFHRDTPNVPISWPDLIKLGRRLVGLSPDQAASLAGMEVRRWLALEDGDDEPTSDERRGISIAFRMSEEEIDRLLEGRTPEPRQPQAIDEVAALRAEVAELRRLLEERLPDIGEGGAPGAAADAGPPTSTP